MSSHREAPEVSKDPVADNTDPPEEDRDPAASAVVALLSDEVLVIDEQPRYHVSGCRALATRSTIPLPAREAVAAECHRRGMPLDPDRVVITAGTSEGIELALTALAGPGDEVLVSAIPQRAEPSVKRPIEAR